MYSANRSTRIYVLVEYLAAAPVGNSSMYVRTHVCAPAHCVDLCTYSTEFARQILHRGSREVKVSSRTSTCGAVPDISLARTYVRTYRRSTYVELFHLQDAGVLPHHGFVCRFEFCVPRDLVHPVTVETHQNGPELK